MRDVNVRCRWSLNANRLKSLVLLNGEKSSKCFTSRTDGFFLFLYYETSSCARAYDKIDATLFIYSGNLLVPCDIWVLF